MNSNHIFSNFIIVFILFHVFNTLHNNSSNNTHIQIAHPHSYIYNKETISIEMSLYYAQNAQDMLQFTSWSPSSLLSSSSGNLWPLTTNLFLAYISCRHQVSIKTNGFILCLRYKRLIMLILIVSQLFIPRGKLHLLDQTHKDNQFAIF